MTQLYETHRPRTWAEVIGQDKAIRRIDTLRSRGGIGGRAYWLSGSSGTGKTTIARLLASDIADDYCVEEIDATDLSAARIRAIELDSHTRGMSFGMARGSELRSGRAYIVNEAHGLTTPAVRQLLTTLERIPAHVAWIFTTTSEQQADLIDGMADATPLLSRCVNLPLSRQGLAKPFAAHVQAIAQREGLDGKPTAAYVALLQKHRNNLRAALVDVESGAMLE